MNNALYWIWLSQRVSTQNGTFDTLIRTYESPYDIYSLEEDELTRLLSNKRDVMRLCDKDISSAQKIIDYCFIKDIGIVTYSSTEYPTRLKMLENPPLVLYYRGKFPKFNGYVSIGVVGTRKMSDYGKRMAFEISRDLALGGASVVSGLALGIDGVAAAAAVSAGGITVAVLGCGIDIVYPPQHERLLRQIIKNGAVISEFVPGTPPDGRNFPLRNRIISGLCQGTVVIEGNKSSGAMITAQHALKQGRELYALPGNVDEPNSESVNMLIKSGAKVITCADDILKGYEFLYPGKINMFRLLNHHGEDMDSVLERFGVQSRENSLLNVNKRMKNASTTASSSQSARVKMPKNKDNSVLTEAKAAMRGEVKQQKDISDAIKALDITTLNIYNLIPYNKAVSADELCGGEMGISDIMTALTILEIKRLIRSEAGGRFSKF